MDDGQEMLEQFYMRNEKYLHLGYNRFEAANFLLATDARLTGPALDVGTGKGVLAITLAQLGLNVVSIDIDRNEQTLAKHLAKKENVDSQIQFVEGDAAHLNYADEYFGCAAMMDVLHHLENPKAVLYEMGRAIKEKGIVIIADFDEQGFDLIARVHRERGDEHKKIPISVDFAQEVLANAGFRCLKRTQGFFHEVAVLEKV
jgi:ubiquinone/menaquinone biosynthesis C-methylase UbiE